MAVLIINFSYFREGFSKIFFENIRILIFLSYVVTDETSITIKYGSLIEWVTLFHWLIQCSFTDSRWLHSHCINKWNFIDAFLENSNNITYLISLSITIVTIYRIWRTKWKLTTNGLFTAVLEISSICEDKQSKSEINILAHIAAFIRIFLSVNEQSISVFENETFESIDK